jgi:hypothetical protein
MPVRKHERNNNAVTLLLGSVFFLKFLDAAGRINQLLLAGKKPVAT